VGSNLTDELAPQDLHSGIAFLVGAFPPPHHGVSNANVQMLERFVRASFDARRVDLSSGNVGQPWARLKRAFRAIGAAMTLLLSRKFPDVVYLGASGGLGRVYDVVILLAARARKARIVIHHHSYRYVNKRDLLESAVVRAAGASALHILLCEHMRTSFCDQYAVDRISTTVLSSAMLAERAIRAMPGRLRSRVDAIGYLGTLSPEKGISEFLAITSSVRGSGAKLLAHIAGPSADRASSAAVADLVTRDPSTRYWGPLHGAEKVQFLDSVDVLIFPSRYPHEAEPLVVYEALAAGIPVVSTRVGCLRTLESSSGVFVLPDAVNFTAAAVDVIAGWLHDPRAYAAASAAARQYFIHRLAEADSEVGRLLAHLRMTVSPVDARRDIV
jgi:glycosyltransferase involved in cell wall biosynthesis